MWLLLVVFLLNWGMAQTTEPAATVKPADAQTKEQPKNKTSEPVVSEQPTSAPANEEEQVEEETDDVVAFYRHPGFQLVPSSKTLSWRNVLKNSLYYDTNYMLVEDDEEGSGVYAVDFTSQLDLRFKRFQVGVDAGFRYEDYFRANDLDELLPFARLRLKYEDEEFYWTFSDEISRSSTVNSLELNDRTAWVRNQLETTAGIRHKRLLAEVGFSHIYVDFRHLRGDYQFYGLSAMVGYELSSRVDATLTYRCDWIDYREAAVVELDGIKQIRQIDTLGHSVLAGVNVRITRQLEGKIGLGVQSRDSHALFAAKAGLTWRPTTRWYLLLEATRQTMPSFIADFQDFTTVSLTTQYLLTRDLACEAGIIVSHVNPRHSDNFIGYYPRFVATYRITQGVELELFYRGAFKRTDQDNAGYDQHLFGGSLNLIF